jgi:hypothetical protein
VALLLGARGDRVGEARKDTQERERRIEVPRRLSVQ